MAKKNSGNLFETILGMIIVLGLIVIINLDWFKDVANDIINTIIELLTFALTLGFIFLIVFALVLIVKRSNKDLD